MKSDTIQANKPVVLIGMMGCGKTHIGRLLARKLGRNFYDSDTLVEERAGCSVAEIFERHGEEKFRRAEANAVHDLLKEGGAIIATGGGAITNPEVLQAIKEQSISVWVYADIHTMCSRVEGNNKRPLLAQADARKKIEALLAEREQFYAQADLKIENSLESEHEVLESLIKSLSEMGNEDTY